MRRKLAAIVVLGLVALTLTGAPAPAPAHIDVTVHEGTSMSVAVSPDGRTLAVDLQGSIWTLPAAGGAADPHHRHLQRRAPADVGRPTASGSRSSPIATAATTSGRSRRTASNQHKLTWGAFDDREPVWSHDGTRVAFSSDRGNPLGSDYNIWTLDMRSGELTQITKNPADDYMPTWSPDDKEIAFASTREDGQSVWAVDVARPAPSARWRAAAGRVDAPSWGPGGQIVYHVTTGGGRGAAAAGRRRRATRSAARRSPAARTCSRSARRGRRRRRSTTCRTARSASASVGGGAPQTIEFTATLQVTRADDATRAASATSRRSTPRQVLGVVAPGDLA